MSNYPTTRKTTVRLNEDQKYQVYKYAIEHHSVRQTEENFEFRVPAAVIATEINDLMLFEVKINGPHVSDAVTRSISWQKRLDKIPVTPKKTVEMDMLQIENTKLQNEIASLKLKLDQAGAGNALTVKHLQEKFQRIKAILVA